MTPTAKIWDAKSGAEVLTLKGHSGIIAGGVIQPGRVAGRDRELGQHGEGLGMRGRRSPTAVREAIGTTA